MIVVIDCNVVISAGLKDGLPRRVVEHVLNGCQPVVTADILDEYRGVAWRPKFAAHVGALAALIERIATAAIIVEAARVEHRLPDSDDGMYVGAALAAHAVCIVTGNLKHFPDRPYGEVEVLSPREFATLSHIVWR